MVPKRAHLKDSVMSNTVALLRTVKSSWRIVRSVQTVSVANGPYSEHIRSVHLIMTSEQSVLRFVRSVRSVRIVTVRMLRAVDGSYAPYGSTNRIYDLSCHENILSPTNEMQFADCKKLFTDPISLLRAIRTVRTDRQTIYDLSCRENIRSPTNEMQCTDRIVTWIKRTVTVRVYWTTLQIRINLDL